MSVRVYCPDCHAARTVPEFGARVRCRNCDRVFRAGTRAGRREPYADRAPEDSTGAQKLVIVLAGIAILVFGLAIGGGLGAWWMLNRPAANEPDDDEVIEANEPAEMPPPPAFGPAPVGPPAIGPPRVANPEPAGNLPEDPDR